MEICNFMDFHLDTFARAKPRFLDRVKNAAQYQP